MATEPMSAKARVDFDARAYPLAAVQRAAHRVTDRCAIVIRGPEDGVIACEFAALAGKSVDLEVVGSELRNAALDECLRLTLEASTEPIRRLILAQAFSRANLVRPDLDSADPRADPSGISTPDSARGSPP